MWSCFSSFGKWSSISIISFRKINAFLLLFFTTSFLKKPKHNPKILLSIFSAPNDNTRIKLQIRFNKQSNSYKVKCFSYFWKVNLNINKSTFSSETSFLSHKLLKKQESPAQTHNPKISLSIFYDTNSAPNGIFSD